MSILDPPSTLIDRDCGRESRIVIRSSSERPTQSDLPLISSEVFNSIASSVDHLPFTSSLLFIPTPLRSPFTFPTSHPQHGRQSSDNHAGSAVFQARSIRACRAALA